MKINIKNQKYIKMRKILVSYIINSSNWDDKLLSYKRAANKAIRVAYSQLKTPVNCEVVINLTA
jgi:hypothetical protein